MSAKKTDTIAAIATPVGFGGVGIVRVSGPLAFDVAKRCCHLKEIEPRKAQLTPFLDAQGEQVDEGLAIFFQGPHSFTGEDVLELQGHGGPMVMDLLLKSVLSVGARLSEPGEFSKRAFLNDKLDLIQAEAIADLIAASSECSARSAMRSLQGLFSEHVIQLHAKLIELRAYVEAAIDFVDEDIDFIEQGKILESLELLLTQLLDLQTKTKQGCLLQEGMTVVLAGKPNAGKSSLLNALAGEAHAIVTDIPGTTRDVVKVHLQIDGLPLHVIDTAGLRKTDDVIEQAGIKRTIEAVASADQVLLVVDASETSDLNLEYNWPTEVLPLPDDQKITWVMNKADLLLENSDRHHTGLYCSAKMGQGLSELKEHLKSLVGFSGGEGMFTARRRHLMALSDAQQSLLRAISQIQDNQEGVLAAEEMRQAEHALGTITGRTLNSDDLLGEIFSRFCVGK